MPIKDEEYTVHFFVENISSTDGHGKNTGVTGENTTTLASLKILQDGNITTATVNSTTLAELHTTDAPGWYSLLISTSENDGDFMNLVGVSTTSNVVIHPVAWQNEDDPVKAYYAKITFNRDAAGGGDDQYTVQWFEHDDPVTSGITSPQIYVFNFAGTDLITSGTSLLQIGTTGAYKFEADGTVGQLKVTPGTTAIVEVTATIDGSTRTWRDFVDRDT